MDNRLPLHVDGLNKVLSIKVHSTEDKYISNTIRKTNQWEPYETKLVIQNLEPGQTFIDVGANIGYFSLIAAEAVGPNGRVLSFEPEAKNYALLAENISHFSFSQVETVHAALSNCDNNGTLYMSEDNWGDHQIYQGATSDRKSQPIRLLRGDQFLLKRLEKVDFIKIDTQGAEYQVVSGLREILLNSLPSLQMIVEFWPQGLRQSGSSGHELLDLLLGLNLPIAIIDHLSEKLTPVHESGLRGWIDKVDENPADKSFANLFVGHSKNKE